KPKGPTNRVSLVAARDPHDLNPLATAQRLVASNIQEGRVLSCHDLSDGGLFVAAAEMCIASGMGLIVGEEMFMSDEAFAERPGRYLIELAGAADAEALRDRFAPRTDVIDVGPAQHLLK